jgi:tetratricopeptide (TPR) repeat protein
MVIDDKALGPDNAQSATVRCDLEMLYTTQQRYALAEPLFQTAICAMEKSLGADHPELARAMVYFANFDFEQKQYEKAQPLARRAAEINEKTLPPNHPDRITALENHAALLRHLNRPAEAEAIEARLKARK